MAQPDLSEFDEQQKATRRQRCSVQILWPKLTDDQQAKLKVALDDHLDAYSSSTISRVVSSWGHRLSPETIRRPRRRVCSCDWPTTPPGRSKTIRRSLPPGLMWSRRCG